MRKGFRTSVVLCVLAGLPWVLPAEDYDVRLFGAKGDGVAKDTAAIQRAVDACAAARGGRVVLDGGTFLSGSLTLKSGVELHIAASATLLGSPDCADYPERTDLTHVVATNLPRYRCASFIFAECATNVAITGRGAIDCNGAAFVRPLSKPSGWWSCERIPGLPTPPRVVFFTGCADIRVVDVTMVNQPAGWSYWIHDCDRVWFDRATMRADVRSPNNDGIHVNCSRDVMIANCYIETGDDAIVVRANSRSLAENRPCERVAVANCVLRSHCSCIRIGYLNDGVVRNCAFSNLTMRDSQIGIRVELPKWREIPDRGREPSVVEDITFSAVAMNRVEKPLTFTVADDPATLCAGVRDVRFFGVTARGGNRVEFRGRPANPLKDFVFRGCSIEVVREPEFANCEGFRVEEGTFKVVK